MKCFLFFFFILMACKDKRVPNNTRPVSKVQNGIQQLVDSFKTEYLIEIDDFGRDYVIDKYNPKLFEFLSTNDIDSIQVHVDTVIINDLRITTKFHTNEDIGFQYTMQFQKEMNKTWDSIYNFMKNLKIGSDTIVNFTYMGSHQLFDPRDETQPTLKVFAFPVPKLHRQE